MPSPSRPIERAKPLLGTIVRIRVEGLPADLAHQAISGAFRAVEDIHRRMSFHDPASELSRLNRDAWRTPVTVSEHTRTVLKKAVEIARASEGLFDPTVAPALVLAGLIPAPDHKRPDPTSSWRDIMLGPDGAVAFERPLWIDLGGIAKGYAVDCAVAWLGRFAPVRVCVEAGGDLRLTGPGAERVHLAAPQADGAIPVLDVEDAAVASSGRAPSCEAAKRLISPHIDPRTKSSRSDDRFATVVAPRCIEADALTKVVMAAGEAAAPVLARYRAQAFLLDDDRWSSLAEAA
jgi:thiamine biosynthesis lipoprotein